MRFGANELPVAVDISWAAPIPDVWIDSGLGANSVGPVRSVRLAPQARIYHHVHLGSRVHVVGDGLEPGQGGLGPPARPTARR